MSQNTQKINRIKDLYESSLFDLAKSLGITEPVSIEFLPKKIEEASLKRFKKIVKLFIITGFSGSGQTSIGKILKKNGVKCIRNVTVRPKRTRETNSDYIFVDESTFWKWEADGKFIHFCKTNNIWYAVLKEDFDQILLTHKRFYMNKSVSSVFDLMPLLRSVDYGLIFILPPSFKVLLQRFKKRQGIRTVTAKENEIFLRLNTGIDQLKMSNNLPYLYLVNDSLKRISSLIVTKRLV